MSVIKNEINDIVSFNDIKLKLQQEDTQLSQALTKLQKLKLIQKVDGYIRFKKFKLTEQGCTQSKITIGKMRELITIS